MYGRLPLQTTQWRAMSSVTVVESRDTVQLPCPFKLASIGAATRRLCVGEHPMNLFAKLAITFSAALVFIVSMIDAGHAAADAAAGASTAAVRSLP